MPMGQARRLCASLVVVPHSFAKYSEISNRIFEELKKVAPIVEQVSIDEAYLDFTGCERLYKSWQESAEKARAVVKAVSGLTASVGVAENKLVAKIASDMAKPNGSHVVPPGTQRHAIEKLSIQKIPGMGLKTSALFEGRGIMTCGDLASYDPTRLKALFGSYALELQRSARGEDDSPVSLESERKSLGSEETFDRDIGDIEVLKKHIRRMAEDLGTNLRDERLKAKTIQIKMRYSDFSTYVRAHTLKSPTYIAKEIADIACHLLEENMAPGLKLRLLGVSCRGFLHTEDAASEQFDFFEDPASKIKREKVEFLKDELKKKFGDGILKNHK
jgi:DNA polymerase-4